MPSLSFQHMNWEVNVPWVPQKQSLRCIWEHKIYWGCERWTWHTGSSKDSHCSTVLSGRKRVGLLKPASAHPSHLHVTPQTRANGSAAGLVLILQEFGPNHLRGNLRGRRGSQEPIAANSPYWGLLCWLGQWIWAENQQHSLLVVRLDLPVSSRDGAFLECEKTIPDHVSGMSLCSNSGATKDISFYLSTHAKPMEFS